MTLEWLLFSSVLVLGILPFLRRGGGLGVRIVLGVLVLAGGGVFAAVKWSDWRERRSFDRAQFLASVPREGRPGGYVSSDSCRSCHPQQYASWHRSYHRTMTQYATPEAVRGKFEGQTLELDGHAYKFERRGDEFWVEMIDPDWKLEYLAGLQPKGQPTRVWKRVGLTTGSHHMQAYWVPSKQGNLQLNLPFSYLFEDERWVPRNDTFLMDPKFPAPVQLWNANCIQCHSTAAQPKPDVKDPSLLRTQTAEIGIACEACHGPAEKHLELNSNPARRIAQYRKDKSDSAIVNPAHLSHKASSHICGQCHSIKSIPPASDWRYEGFKFRPGEDLEKFTPVIRPTQPRNDHTDPKFLEERYWPDGMVRVSGREFNGLVESPCYQRGTMSCLSCHSMHQSDPNDQLGRGMESNAACTQCHKDIKADHTRHVAASSGSLCYNCHMPHTVYGLMKAIRSHQVDSPSAQASLKTGRPNACNLCHLDKTLAWTAEKLSAWYGIAPPELSQEQKTYSAAAVWLLRGDAGQRALLAWHMGWAPARQASGERWLAPYLAQLLEDPYSTVRYIARRSLRALPGYGDFPFDYIALPEQRTEARRLAWTKWEQTHALNLDRSGPEILIRPSGEIDQATWQSLLQRRDNKSMYLQE